MAGEESVLVRAEEATATVGGKTAVTSAVGGAGAASGSMSSAFGAVFSTVGVATAAAASVVINQIVYNSKIKEMVNLYKDEVGAQLGKSADKVDKKDLERVAGSNKTLAEGLNKIKNKRNIGFLVTTGSLLGTVGIMLATGIGATPIIAGAGLAAVANFAVVAAIGFGIHSILEKPMHWASKKIFGKQDSTHDLIRELKSQHRDGKAITREQVVGVFVSANKELGNFVKSQFGKSYDELSVQQKRSVSDSFEQYLPATALTERLNSGSVKISELAFAVEGQSSGVAPDSTKDNLSIVGEIRKAMHSPHSPPKRKVVEYDNPTPKRSFVELVESRRGVELNR